MVDDAPASWTRVLVPRKSSSLCARLSEIDAKTVQKSGFFDLPTMMDRWQEYLNRQANPGTLLGVGTGFPTIDEATSGLQGGQLVVIVAPAKVGKTQLMLRVWQLTFTNRASAPYSRASR